MLRPPRVFVEGGIYHVYNRVTRGEKFFAEDHEAAGLLDAMREVRDRDHLIVLAWCIMTTHPQYPPLSSSLFSRGRPI